MLDNQIEQLPRGRVDPMRVLKNHHHWLLMCEPLKLQDQCRQRPFLFALRTEIRQRVVLRSRQRQQIGDKRYVLLGGRGAGGAPRPGTAKLY